MEFRVLGVLEALEDGLPIALGAPKQRSVLAMLLLEPNRSVSTDRLVDGLWGDDPPSRPAATLQVYVSHLRKALEPDRGPRAEPSVLLTQPPGYLLAVDPEQVDLFRFDALVAVARTLTTDGCVTGAAVVFREALGLWRESPLADLANEPWARFEIPRLEEARTGAIEDRVDADLALGRDVELLPELEALVARNPYRERLRCQLMLALYRAGRQADALAAYQAARQVLVDELGLEPSRELREMEAAILVQEPTLAPTEPAPIGADQVARVLRAVDSCRAGRRGRRNRRGGRACLRASGRGSAPTRDRSGTDGSVVGVARGRRRHPGRARRAPAVSSPTVSSTGAPGTRPAPPWLGAPRTGREARQLGRAPTRACCASSPRTRAGTSAASASSRSSWRRSRALPVPASSVPPGAGSRHSCAPGSSPRWATTRCRAARGGRACSSHRAPIPCSSSRGLSHPDVTRRRRITFATGCSRTPSR